MFSSSQFFKQMNAGAKWRQSTHRNTNQKHGLAREIILDDASAFWTFTHLKTYKAQKGRC